MAEEGGRVPMSPGLQATLLRARDYAAGQSEAQVLLEHLLLALSEDADAAHVLEACRVDLDRLRNDVAGYLGSLDDRVAPGTPGAPAISQSLTQVLRYATLAAQQGRRSSIDGAIVLAALVGDGRSMAASFLKSQGLTFDAAIQALRQAATRGTDDPAHAATPVAHHAQGAQSAYAETSFATTTRAEDILARARERVETRSQPRPDAPGPTPDLPAPPSTASPPPPHQPPDVAVAAAPPQAGPMPAVGVADRDDDRTAVPPQPVEPPPSQQDDPPTPADPGSSPDETDAPVSAPTSRPNGAVGDASMAPPGPPASTAEPFTLPADMAEPPAAPPRVLPPEHPTASPAPAPGAPDRTSPPASTGWAPPPMRPATPQTPAPRSSAPLPHGRSTPPSPPSQSPRPPGSLPVRPPGTGPAPAQWPHPPMHTDPQREPAGAGYPPPAVVPSQAGPGYGGPTGAQPAIAPSQVTHSIPRRLRPGRPQVIEVWIERPPITGNAGSRSFALRPENVVARAIAVRLRPLSGKLVIDAASPETQWDQSGAAGSNRLASEAAVWRFTVTPLRSGRAVLQLAISARTLGADGVLAETQLPDQTYDLRVARSYGRLFRRTLLTLGTAIAGMVLIKLVEVEIGIDFYYLVKQLLRSHT